MPSSPRAFVRLAALALAAVACTADRINAPAASQADVPLAAFSVASTPPLVITEVMANPVETNDVGEWIEIFNAGYTDVDLRGWRLGSVTSNGNPESHTIPASRATPLVVPAGKCVVLANTTSAVGVPIDYSYGSSIPLGNNAVDLVRLSMPDGTLVDEVAYSGSGKTYNATNNSGVARVMKAPAAGVDITSVDNSVLGDTDVWTQATNVYNQALNNRGTPGGCSEYSQSTEGGEVVRVTVTPSSATAVIGRTVKLSATGRDAFDRVSSTTFTWASRDEAVAAVDETGLVTGVAEGATRIVATSANGFSDSATVTVTAPQPASLSISINFPDTLPVGYTKPAFATVRDAGGTIITPAPKLTWTSGNPDAFTIDSIGYITARAVGQGAVSATTPNGVTGSWFAPFVIIPADAPTSAVYRDHLAFGTPDGGNLLRKKQYVLSYNAARGGPNWVSWNINASHFGDARRCDCFSADVTLPSSDYRVVDFDYRNSGWDRGHMVQSETRTSTNQENAATFLLTNILPQAAENNQGPWSKFENYLNDLARGSAREIYVVAGGVYPANPATLKNEGRVAIPHSTWKIAVIMPGGAGRADVHAAGDIELIAIEIPNEASPGTPITGIRNNPWEQYRTTVDLIEAETGYDLLENLPDHIENALEKGDRAPVASFSAPAAGVEGSQLAFDASQSSDPDPGDALSYEWSFGDGATATGRTATHTFADNGSYTVTLRVVDRDGADAITTKQVAVANAAPAITGFDVPGLASARVPATVTVAYTDAGSADSHTISVNWGDGSTSSVAGDAGIATARHAYQNAGFYTVQVTLTDDDGASVSRTATQYVVVYDAAAGFVTGGGFVEPDGRAMKGNQKATFTSSVRYADGSAPEGHVNVQLHGRGVSFQSDALQWMVIDGTRAWILGTGTIDGESGTYNVLVSLADVGNDDLVRIRIWSATGAVVYDNQPGAAISALPVGSLGGGNLTVHANP